MQVIGVDVKRKHNSHIGFLDILFINLVGFVFLLTISLLLVQPQNKKDGVRPKAEFLITVSWENNDQNDIDTWLRDPAGNICFFKDKDTGLMNLDRDDLGSSNDTIQMPDGTVIDFPYNEETMTIRGIIPGEWILNVHFFKEKNNPKGKPTKVTIRINKMNPTTQTVFQKTVILEKPWQEITV